VFVDASAMVAVRAHISTKSAITRGAGSLASEVKTLRATRDGRACRFYSGRTVLAGAAQLAMTRSLAKERRIVRPSGFQSREISPPS
jgi:hypothetical protein